MKNYIQEGRMITVAAPAGGVTSGDGVVIGSLFGVASKTAAAGETVTIATEGVFRAGPWSLSDSGSPSKPPAMARAPWIATTAAA